MVNSPLTGKKAILEKEIHTNWLIDSYKKKFNLNTSYLFESVKDNNIRLY